MKLFPEFSYPTTCTSVYLKIKHGKTTKSKRVKKKKNIFQMSFSTHYTDLLPMSTTAAFIFRRIDFCAGSVL